MQNVVLLPHIGSASVVTRNAMDQLVVDNLKAWFAGKPPLTPVAGDPRKGQLMKFRFCLRCGAAGARSVASPARAQDAATLKKNMIGQWELSTTERSKTCVVTLKPDTTPQGLKLELEPGCAAALPFTKDITGWNVKGLDIVRLQDATGEAVIDFTEVEAGILEGVRSGEGVYILQNLAAARSLAKSMDQMIGDWAMVRGNGNVVLRPGAHQQRRRQRQFPGVSEAEMRSRGRLLRADAVAARARPDHADVRQAARPGASRPTTTRNGGWCPTAPIP